MRTECVLCQVLTEIVFYYLGVFEASKVKEVEIKFSESFITTDSKVPTPS
jgi:hypothetical protein